MLKKTEESVHFSYFSSTVELLPRDGLDSEDVRTSKLEYFRTKAGIMKLGQFLVRKIWGVNTNGRFHKKYWLEKCWVLVERLITLQLHVLVSPRLSQPPFPQSRRGVIQVCNNLQ